jgi:hypothetical protein
MRCPTCNADLPDGLVRCTLCNTALDPAAELGFDQQWDDPQASGVELYTSAQGTAEHAAPPEHLASPAQPQPAPYLAGEPQPAPEASQAAVHTRIVTMDPEQERGTRIVDVSVPQVARRAGRSDTRKPRGADEAAAELGGGVEDLFDTMKRGYARMHRVDRLTTWVGLFALVAAFLPWRYKLGEGLIAGIQGLGGAAAAAFVVVLLCVFARTARRRLTGLLLALQVLAAGGGTVVPVFVFLFHTGTAASFGLYLTALGGAATIVLTLARLAVRNF